VVSKWPHAQEDIVSYDDEKALRKELEGASSPDSMAIEKSLRRIDQLKVDDEVTLREKMCWSELTASVTYKKLKVGAMVRDLFRKDEKSCAIQAYVMFDIGRFGLSPFAQYFRGYGETLLRHAVFEDQRVDVGAQIRFR
jgi:outer membrane phospholipase A